MAKKDKVAATQEAEAASETPTNGNGGKPEKKVCPISRVDFKGHAKPLEITINGVPMVAEVKEFSTGSLGWMISGKTVVKVGDHPLSVQIGLNLTVVNSKDLPGGPAAK